MWIDCGTEVKNEELRRREQVERQFSCGVDQCVLRWFGHVERMDDEKCMAKRVVISDIEGNRCRGRPRLEWMNGVRMVLGERVYVSGAG